MSFCEESYATGYRRGQPCPYMASNIIFNDSGFKDAGPRLACGYHARAYSPSVVYPLNWSLATIRRFQRSNLDRLLG